MSNDLILQSIKNELAQLELGLDEDTRAVAGTMTGKRISIKGGVFRKIVNGKETAALDARFMDIIFVRMAHTMSRTYYTGTYEESNKKAPACWSSDGRVPDKEVNAPIAENCDNCPMSVKGSSVTGVTTACRLSWRTAVVLPNDPAGDVMQLVLPAASCLGQEEEGKRPFRAYVQYLAGHDVSAGRVVTKMQFDMKVQFPRVMFTVVGAVPKQDIPTVLEQSKTPEATNAIKLTVFQQDDNVDVEDVAPPVKQPAPAPLTATPEKEPIVVIKAKPDPAPAVQPEAQPAVVEAHVSDLVKKWASTKNK